jgi:hypothetical protein
VQPLQQMMTSAQQLAAEQSAYKVATRKLRNQGQLGIACSCCTGLQHKTSQHQHQQVLSAGGAAA